MADEDIQTSSEKKAKLLSEIKARTRAAALNGLSPAEKEQIIDLVFKKIARSGLLTPEDIVSSSAAAGVPEDAKAAQTFVEGSASDKKALNAEDFLMWWATPVQGNSSRKLPLFKASLQTQFYQAVEEAKRVKPVTSPFGDNPAAWRMFPSSQLSVLNL